MKKIYTLLLIITLSITTQAQVVISQVYGGGGNAGATYTNDFIELYNRGIVAQNLSGWSVQYASTNGTTWAVTQLPSFNLLPGQYYLIQQAAGTTPVLALPTPDLDGITCNCTYNTQIPPVLSTTGIAMSGSNGKIILVSSVTPETSVNPVGSQIIDKVGYGTTPNGYEGTGPTGTTLTSTTSAQRNNAGCIDTNNNSVDFTAALPLPRNSSSPLNTCSLSTNQNQISGLQVYPNPTKNILNITTDLNSTKNIEIYDMIGKKVLVENIQTQLNVSSLLTGMYIVKITEDGKTSTKRLAIN
jgi:predicted extracellular nuclease